MSLEANGTPEKKGFWESILGDTVLWFVKSFFGLELNVLKDEIKTPKAPRKDPASSELIKVNMGNSFLNKFFPLYAPRKLAQALYSGQLDGKRFFGVYATGDKDGEKFAGQYEKAHSMGLDRFIGKFKGTPITPDMVRNSAHKYKVDPYMVAVVMANDSSMGTKGMGARNRNPGNVAQFDHLKNAVAWYATRQEWVDAVANNIAKRQNKLIASVKKNPASYTA